MSKKNKYPARQENENYASQSEQSGEHSNDIKKLELQHLVLNKMLNSKKKSFKSSISGLEINLKRKNRKSNHLQTTKYMKK